MISTSFSLLPPSIPILLIPAGVQSAEIDDIIKKASREPFKINSINQKQLIEECKNSNIPCPKDFWAQFFPCFTLADYKFLSSRFIAEKSLYFYQYISVIIIIDFSENNSIDQIREEYSQIINKAFPTGFFIYKAKESILDLADESTNLFFEINSKDKVYYYLSQFAINFVFKAILQNTIFDSRTRFSNELKVFPIRVSLLCVSSNVDEILNFFESDVKKSIKTQNRDQLAPFFEICAILDKYFPGFIQKLQISDLFYIGKAPWVDDESKLTSDVAKCFSISGYLYHLNHSYLKAVDCGLRCISYGFTSFLNPVASFIQTYAKEPLMKYWAIEIVLLSIKFNFPRKAALFAYSLSNFLPENDRLPFVRNCLKLIQKNARSSNSKLQYEVAIPLIMILKDTDVKLCTEITAEILNDYGPKLPLIIQKQLFQSLSFFSSSEILIPSKLSLNLLSISIEKSQCLIRPKIKRSVSNDDQNNSVFIYNYYKLKSSTTLDHFSGVNQPIRFLIRIQNNFQVSLPISISFPFSEDYENDQITYNLHPSNPNLVSVVVIPTKIQKYNFSSIRCSLFGLYDDIKLPNRISVNVIDFPVNFNATTDLPIFRPIQAYIGEIIDFSVYINNQGKYPITSIFTYFKKESNFKFDISYDKSELPLEPVSMMEISCHLQFLTNVDIMEFEVACTSENPNFEFVVNIKQPLSITSGLLPKSIYPIQNPPAIPDYKSSSMILIGVEIENKSNETFSYDALFDASSITMKNTGILSKDVYHDILGSQKKVTLLCPILKKLLLDQMQSIDPSDARVIKAARDAELVYGISGSMEERQKIVQLTNLQIFLKDHFSFKWESIDRFHRGSMLVDSALPDLSFLEEMAKSAPKVSVRFVVDNEDTTDIFVEQIIDVVVDFGDFLINKCSVDIKKYQNPALGLIWEGKLCKDDKNGSSKFDFRFCFCTPGVYELPINYCSIDNHIIGTEIVVINVTDNQ